MEMFQQASLDGHAGKAVAASLVGAAESAPHRFTANVAVTTAFTSFSRLDVSLMP
jgi:hypothetical protein